MTTTTHQKIGKKIRIARKQMGMTQSDLAKKLGRSGAAIAYLEQGKRRISTEILTMISHFTSKPLSFFYGDEGDSDRQLKKQLEDLRGHLDGIKTLLDDAEKNKKEVENKLQLFRTLLDQSNDAIAIWDPETGKALDCNERLCLNLGYSREEFLQKSIFDIETGIPHMAAWKACVREAQKKKYIILPTKPMTKAGEISPAEVSVNYIEVDECSYIVVIARDLADRKQQEQYLAQQIQRNRLMLESYTVGVYFSDLQGNITEVNSVLWDVLGVPPELRSEDDFSVIEKALQLSGIRNLAQQSIEQLKESSQVLSFHSPWKKKITLSVRIVPVQYTGYVLGIQGLLEQVREGEGLKGSKGRKGCKEGGGEGEGLKGSKGLKGLKEGVNG